MVKSPPDVFQTFLWVLCNFIDYFSLDNICVFIKYEDSPESSRRSKLMYSSCLSVGISIIISETFVSLSLFFLSILEFIVVTFSELCVTVWNVVLYHLYRMIRVEWFPWINECVIHSWDYFLIFPCTFLFRIGGLRSLVYLVDFGLYIQVLHYWFSCPSCFHWFFIAFLFLLLLLFLLGLLTRGFPFSFLIF